MPDTRLCVGKDLRCYLAKTRDLRKGKNQLLISFRDPHGLVSKDTIARWIREDMASACIDMNIYNALSMTSLSVSAAGASFVPVKDIIERAGWGAMKILFRSSMRS